MNDVKGKGYEHYIPMRKEDPTWFSKLTTHLVSSFDELRKIFDEHSESKYMAWDTETTGLNFAKDKIVGYSFAFNNKEGWYVPLRHLIGNNLPVKESFDLFYQVMLSKQNFTYNFPFDAQMYENEGYDLSKIRNYDVQVGVFFSDTNWKKTGLKLAEKRFLGWSADTFEETLGDNQNFSYLDPSEGCYQYACVDAIGTFAVCERTIQFYKEARVAGLVTNAIRYPFMKVTQSLIRMDRAYLEKMEMDTIEHMKDLEHNVIARVGYPFKLNSNKQLGDALQSIGISTGVFTKTGQMKVDIKALTDTNLREPDEILTDLIEYSKTFKLFDSYIEPLLRECKDKSDHLRYRFSSCMAPTCRMVSGGDKNNPYYAAINVMAIPKPHPLNWYVHNYHEGDILQDGDQIIGPWRFSMTDKSEYITEGTNPKMNMRCAFLPDEGHYVVGMDYSSQELCCQANLANVSVWVNTMLTGGDLHKAMAVSMWGAENYDKEKRKKAKCLNFGMLYGMSEYTLADRFHISVEEGKDIENRWWKAVPEISAYQRAMVRAAKKTGTTYNYFGAPRRVKYYLESDDAKKRAFGERTVGNNPIQSTCAILTQMSFLKVYKYLYSNPDWIDDCHFFSFIHDEIVSSVKKERVWDFIPIQRLCMEKKFDNLPVPFTTSVAIGNSWGNTFEMKYTSDNNLVPDYDVDESYEGPEHEKPVVQRLGKVSSLKEVRED